MKVIYVNSVEIKVQDETVIKMMECVNMETNQEILIRSKKDAVKLSKQILEYSEMMIHERYLEALENKDHLYLSSVYDALSFKDIFKMLALKVQRRIQ